VTFGPTTFPTRITLARLAACPVFVALFCLAIQGDDPTRPFTDLEPTLMIAALAVLVLQEVSDIVDGVLARRHGLVTELGKLLDPLADTLSHMGAFLCLMWVGLVPLWLLIVMYYREAIVGTLRVIAARNNLVMGARFSGKLKAMGQAFTANLLVFLMILKHYDPAFPIEPIALILSVLLAAVTLVSLGDYYLAVRDLVKRKG
jgi:CDP-diacylglycerol--glycerol-3-phosphate 3-phosphatidyltransferase